MATPIGHAVAGLVISGVSKPQTRKERIALALVCTFAALAPDLDVIPGLLLGTPARFHGGISHSLGFAVALSLAIAGAYRLVGKPSKEIFLLAVTAYISHLALDMLGPDGRPPYGIPFFWPLVVRRSSRRCLFCLEHGMRPLHQVEYKNGPETC